MDEYRIGVTYRCCTQCGSESWDGGELNCGCPTKESSVYVSAVDEERGTVTLAGYATPSRRRRVSRGGSPSRRKATR